VLLGDLGIAQTPSTDLPGADAAEQLPDSLRPDDFGAEEITATNTTLEQLQVADWLGPLAPVALSPFFGMACLSAFAIWGGDWMSGNSLLAAAGPLKNEVVFGTFVVLTLLTSLPRMTKVSKPFAQAMDQLEAYSVIIILIVIKLFGASGSADVEAPIANVQFASFSITTDGLLAIAMAINLFVINSVKFFFEVLIWLTPIPAIDALFEVCNKLLCLGLMSLYAFSPTLATIVNLLLLTAALLIFRWANRRLTYYRTMLLDPILALVWKSYGHPSQDSFIAFARDGEPLVAKSRWRLTRTDGSWHAQRLGWLGITANEKHALKSTPEIHRGWIIHTLATSIEDGTPVHFHFSRRFDADLSGWANHLGLNLLERETSPQDTAAARAEFG
ncbi:MAG: hypothetical protein AAFX06_33570, partial [Planctomycetota bacterium]